MNDKKGALPSEARGSNGAVVASTPSLPLAREPYGSLAPAGAEGSADFTASLREYWRILYKRKWLVAGVAGTFLVLGTVATLMMMPLYTATVRLQIDRNVAKIVEGGNVTPVEGSDTEFLRTQYELLQSRSLAERAVSALRLGNDADFLRPRGFSLLQSL